MKKLIFLFLSLLAAGSLFQACDDSKTYAEMLEDEKNAVNKFIKDSAIHIISQEEFERNDSITKVKGVEGAQYDEYVAFSNGVYMQIIDRGDMKEEDKFVNSEEICVRYLEKDVATRELTCFNVFIQEFADASQLYAYPAVFRYVDNGSSSSYGIFTQMDYFWSEAYGSTAVPAGWLVVLPYVRNYSHVRLIVPSKMGHQSAQQAVAPYFYDIWTLSKAES